LEVDPVADLYNNLHVVESLPAAARTATANGAAVDRANFGSVMVAVHAGDVTDGTHTIKLQTSANGSSGWTDVPAEELQGSFSALTSSVDSRVVEVGYLGSGRFLRVVSTVASATSGGVFGATVLLGDPFVAPVDREAS
jgi:hypothetical protein